MQPEYIFETSWEVCNKVGGIYAVLSTRAATMQQLHKDKVFFFGPDLGDTSNVFFKENKTLLGSWRKQAEQVTGLKLRIGRWLIPGKPIAILIDFSSLWLKKDEIYYYMWEHFQVNSIQAYGDYDESSLFGYAVGMAMESLYNHINASNLLFQSPTVAHFNEWQTAFGLLYTKLHCPAIGTLFTTHATGIGRSIAGNNKPLYDYFEGYHGDQMAEELNMVSKHSAEKQAAHFADCFTTVSDITARECKQLLDKPVDIVTPNGFETGFVPQTAAEAESKRHLARTLLRSVAEQVLGYQVSEDSLLTCISGRYEFKNKGIDALLYALKKANAMTPQKQVVCFCMIPAWQSGAHTQLGKIDNITTHQLVEPLSDPILNTMRYLNLQNSEQDSVKVIFVPSYLKGNDGILNMSYYDLLIGMDLTIFPSYYEPWGYTPLESVAFSVPTITTNLAGFGQWANENQNTYKQKPVTVIARTDSNWEQMTDEIARTVVHFASLNEKEMAAVRKAANQIAEKALWKHFFKYYTQAYEIALSKKA